MILTDLQKAFGTINHEILLKSLNLQLLLFLIYVNDMPQAVKSSLFSIWQWFCLAYQHRDVEEIEK